MSNTQNHMNKKCGLTNFTHPAREK